jgi:hypothetical protein
LRGFGVSPTGGEAGLRRATDIASARQKTSPRARFQTEDKVHLSGWILLHIEDKSGIMKARKRSKTQELKAMLRENRMEKMRQTIKEAKAGKLEAEERAVTADSPLLLEFFA